VDEEEKSRRSGDAFLLVVVRPFALEPEGDLLIEVV